MSRPEDNPNLNRFERFFHRELHWLVILGFLMLMMSGMKMLSGRGGYVWITLSVITFVAAYFLWRKESRKDT